MPETPIQKPKPSHASILLDSAKASFNRVVRLIPPKGRAALLTGLIVLIGLAVYTSLTGSATLNLICRHALRSADISVSIDGKTIYADHISARLISRFLAASIFSAADTQASGVSEVFENVIRRPHLPRQHPARYTEGKAGGCILLPNLDATMEISVQREISA